MTQIAFEITLTGDKIIVQFMTPCIIRTVFLLYSCTTTQRLIVEVTTLNQSASVHTTLMISPENFLIPSWYVRFFLQSWLMP
jgi:hypothetical protein